MLPKKKILSIDISNGTYSEFVSAIINLAKTKTSSYVCVANVHMLIEAHQSKSFQQIVNNADLVTPDGMPLAKSFKLLHNQHQDRVDGMSLLPALLSQSDKENLSVYFYGGAQNMLDSTFDYLKTNYSSLDIAGMYSPPFRSLTTEESKEIINKIKESGANIVFVVLGCPKQEKWMNEMKGKIPALMIGIGGALPVLVGMQKRAPNWMQKNSLEWLFRLIQEPKRLFKRYFKTNTLFLYLIIKEKLKKK
ncbi:WecB/TagA/CpsF family glycosyltransferase [Pedobacter sp. MC2016-24]|uniref:WecB/TagA/CpsF family glycosyltransferase n=1 Tax=Pedobacter sp. MC2016-24 TaxID=2780090 RepID=UPI0018825245|nr:WecB/TagA/CpsF family glycosyltransferase [Pedobacter sp. MC2016-24]MBE9599533.1 WecB/TagA/CpsF family glycosyltransferase [Pedobacter sp. MC2016-24]